MDLEKNKQRLEILAAEVEELKNNGGGGGGDLSDYLTKAEANNTYETKSAAAAALALKADASTTYTKDEVNQEISSGTSVMANLYSSTTLVPLETGYPVSCDVPWSHITRKNDFTIRKTVNDVAYVIRFQYSQSTSDNSFTYKGSFVHPTVGYLYTYIVEMAPAADASNPTSIIKLIGTFQTAPES